jgi:hypothetical protein
MKLWLVFAPVPLGLASCVEAPRAELMNAESPATGPAGVPGSGGTGAAGSFGSGGTFGGTTEEGARETAGGAAGRAVPRMRPDGG